MAGKTEWEDALIKHGIMAAPEERETEDDKHLRMLEGMDQARAKALESKSLDELEDELDDDVLEIYRRNRIQKMQEDADRKTYGTVKRIGQTEFIDQVTNASKTCPVVCHLFESGVEDCNILDQLLAQLAFKFRHVKFVKILGNEAIANYPASNCPTILVYNKGDMIKQFVHLGVFGGKKASVEIIEWVFSQLGILETSLDKDPRESMFKLSSMIGKRATADAEHSDDDDW